MILEFTITNRKKYNDSIGVYYDFETDEIIFTDGINSSEGFIRNVDISDELQSIIEEIGEDIGEILWDSIKCDYKDSNIVVEFYYNGLMEYFSFNNILNDWKVILNYYNIFEALELTNAEVEEVIALAKDLGD